MTAPGGRADAVIDRAASSWDRLAGELGATPFDRPGWLRAWWDAFGQGVPELHTAEAADGELSALLLTRRAGARRTSSTNWHSISSGLLARDAAAAAALGARLVADRPPRLTLQFLDEAGPVTEGLVEGLSRAGYEVRARPLEQPPFLALSGAYADFERTLGKNLRGDVRRRRRRLDEAGEVVLDLRDGTEGLDALLDEGFAIEGSGWKTAAGTAIVSRPETARFYRRLAHWAAGSGWLSLAFLRLDGTAIAFHLNLVHDGVLYHLKGGFDPAFERFSPGKLLHAAMIEDAFARGLRRYEFLGSDEPYKLKWSTGERRLVTVEAFAPTLAGRAHGLAHRHLRPLAARAVERLAGRRRTPHGGGDRPEAA